MKKVFQQLSQHSSLATLGLCAIGLIGCDGNSLPQWQSSDTLSVPTHIGGKVYQAHAIDPDGKAVTYALKSDLPSGWAFDASSGVLSAAPRGTADAPAGTVITLAATDLNGGESLLELNVSFDYLTRIEPQAYFPPNHSNVNLGANESVTFSIKNVTTQYGKITGINIYSDDPNTPFPAMTLSDDQSTWNHDFQLTTGVHQLGGYVTYENGYQGLTAVQTVHINNGALSGDISQSNIQAGHQYFTDSQQLAYFSDGALQLKNIRSGQSQTLWQSDSKELAYFGINASQETAYILQLVGSTTLANSDQILSVGTVMAPDDAPLPLPAVPSQLTLTTIDLATGLETAQVIDVAFDLSASIYKADFNPHNQTFWLSPIGIGGGGTDVMTADAMNAEGVDELSLYFSINADTAQLTQHVNAQGNPFGPLSIDAENLSLINFDDYDGTLRFGTLPDNTELQSFPLTLAGIPTEASITPGVDEARFGYFIESDLVQNNDGAVFFSNAHLLMRTGDHRNLTQCSTALEGKMNGATFSIEQYPNHCLAGIGFDMSLDLQRDLAFVSTLNLHLPSFVVVNDDANNDPDLNNIFAYTHHQVVNLKTGQVATIHQGF